MNRRGRQRLIQRGVMMLMMSARRTTVVLTRISRRRRSSISSSRSTLRNILVSVGSVGVKEIARRKVGVRAEEKGGGG